LGRGMVSRKNAKEHSREILWSITKYGLTRIFFLCSDILIIEILITKDYYYDFSS